MGFRINDFEFYKVDGGVNIRVNGRENDISIPDNAWISVITEMSHKPENADQHKAATNFHVGE